MVGALSSTTSFEQARPALVRVAYRMLGSLVDAEDVVQEAWVRWSAVEHQEIREPAAFLRRTVIRLCVDVLKSARSRHETYVGPWLPDPIVEEEEVDDVTLPLMLALERLSPLERAALLLHDIFGESFEEVAVALGRDVAACRQLASRARRNIREDRPRFSVSSQRGTEIASAFFAASRQGDIAGLGAILAEDVRMHSDGGGKRPAASRILIGFQEVSRVLAGIAKLVAGRPSQLLRYAFVNGLPGFVTVEADGIQTTALLIEDERIVAIYVMRNPDKLRHLEGAVH